MLARVRAFGLALALPDIVPCVRACVDWSAHADAFILSRCDAYNNYPKDINRRNDGVDKSPPAFIMPCRREVCTLSLAAPLP